MVSKSILYNWLATNKIQAVFDDLLSRNPVPEMVIHSSSRYHAHLEAKLEDIEDSATLRIELNKIRITLKHIISQLAETPSSIQIQNYPMSGVELLNDLLVGMGGNAAYDGLKIARLHLTNKTISSAEREIFEKVEALLDLSIRNIKTQTEVLAELHQLRQVIDSKNKENSAGDIFNNYGTVENQFIKPVIHGGFHIHKR